MFDRRRSIAPHLVSGYGTIGRVEAAYFPMINELDGSNGRWINFLLLDDGFRPRKTV